MTDLKTIRAGELLKAELPVAVNFSSGLRIIDAITPKPGEHAVSLFHSGTLVGHFYNSTEIRILEHPNGEYDPNCPACLRARIHSESEHEAGLRRARGI